MATDLQWLIAKELPHMQRFALGLTRHQDKADDVVQDSIEKALRKRFTWNKQGSLRSWLLRIVYTTYLNSLRKQKRQFAATSEALTEQESWHPNPDASLECKLAIEALYTLNQEHREALLLVTVEGLAYEQAAFILKIPVGTLRSRLNRGREALRETIENKRRPAYLKCVQ